MDSHVAMLSRQTRCTIVLRMSAHATARRYAVGPRAHGKVRKSYRDREREREEEGAPVADCGRGVRFDRRARSRPATAPPWPTSRMDWPLEFFCEMLRRNVAQKCWPGKWPAHILGGWVPRWDFYTDGRKKMKETRTSRCRRRLCEKKKKKKKSDRSNPQVERLTG